MRITTFSRLLTLLRYMLCVVDSWTYLAPNTIMFSLNTCMLILSHNIRIILKMVYLYYKYETEVDFFLNKDYEAYNFNNFKFSKNNILYFQQHIPLYIIVFLSDSLLLICILFITWLYVYLIVETTIIKYTSL